MVYYNNMPHLPDADKILNIDAVNLAQYRRSLNLLRLMELHQ